MQRAPRLIALFVALTMASVYAVEGWREWLMAWAIATLVAARVGVG